MTERRTTANDPRDAAQTSVSGDPASASGDSALVAARLRYIERQARLDPAAFGATFQGRAPEGSGPENRHGRPKLPPGQREVRNWPVLDLGVHPDVSRAEWRLAVQGLVHRPVTLTFEDLQRLPRTELELDFHCVTTWSRMDLKVVGVRLADLCSEVVPRAEALHVTFTGSDTLPGTEIPYTTNLPLARVIEPDVLLVYEVDGAPLTREHGGPVRVIVPRLYAWKGAKWVRGIEFTAEDRPGFWETRGYSNTGEPWFSDRYSGR